MCLTYHDAYLHMKERKYLPNYLINFHKQIRKGKKLARKETKIKDSMCPDSWKHWQSWWVLEAFYYFAF